MPLVFLFTKIMCQTQIDIRGKKTEGGLTGTTERPAQHGRTTQKQRHGPGRTAHLLKTAQNITARPDPTPAVLLIVPRAYARFWTAQCVWLADGCSIFCLINGCRLSAMCF